MAAYSLFLWIPTVGKEPQTRIESLHFINFSEKGGGLSTKINCLSGELVFARNKRRAFTEISKRVWELDNIRQIRDVTNALRYGNEIPPCPLPYQISTSPIAVRTCWEQWKKVPLVLHQRSGKGHAQWTVSYGIFRHAILISVSLDCCEAMMFVALRSRSLIPGPGP